jgi:hypothetical protein
MIVAEYIPVGANWILQLNNNWFDRWVHLLS